MNKQSATPKPLIMTVDIPSPQAIEEIQFVKGWAGIMGNKLIFYPPFCIAVVGFKTGELAKKDAAALINKGTAKPYFGEGAEDDR